MGLFHVFSSPDAELEIPAINTMMPEPYIRTSQGFTFTWNEPALLEDPSFLSEYRVMIVLVTGHQKRQTSFITTTDHNTRKYTFDQGMPHTTYSVSVDGVVNRNGVIATVPALTPSNLTTAQARELVGGESAWVCVDMIGFLLNGAWRGNNFHCLNSPQTS